MVTETSMGISLHTQEDETCEYVKSVKEMGRILMTRALTIKHLDLVYRFSRDYYKEKNALKILHGVTDSVIAEKRKQLQNDKKASNENNLEFGVKKRLAFLDLLMNIEIDGEPLSDADIREEVDTFMFEVSEPQFTR